MSRYVGLYGFGRQVSPDFPGESPGIVWSPEKWTDTRARVGVDGLSGRASRRCRWWPRSARSPTADCTSSRASCARCIATAGAISSAPKVLRRTISAETAATLTTIMEEVVDRRHGEARADSRVHDRGKDRHRAEAGQRPLLAQRLQRVVCRLHPVARAGAGDRRRHRFGERTRTAITAALCRRADLQATSPRAALHYLGIPPTINPAPPVLVARRDGTRVRAGARRRRGGRPIVSLVADGAPGTMPDLRGMSAREAVRALVRLGMTARVSGDGFVVSQDPAAGTPIDAEARLPPGAAAPTRRLLREPPVTWAELHGALRRVGLIRADAAVRAEASVGRGDAGSRTTRASSTRGHVFVALKGHARRRRGVRARRRSTAARSRSCPKHAAAGRRPRAVGDRLRRAARARACSPTTFYRDHPSREMRVVGITGTNGKTTTAYLARVDLRGGRRPLRRLGTVALPHRRRDARGDAYDAGSAGRAGAAARDGRSRLRRLRDGGVVARAGAAARRRHDVRRRRVHEPDARSPRLPRATWTTYFRAKRRLFEMLPRDAPSVINVDDPRGAVARRRRRPRR